MKKTAALVALTAMAMIQTTYAADASTAGKINAAADVSANPLTQADPGLPGVRVLGDVAENEWSENGQGPMTSAARLLWTNMKIYSNVGWQAGRFVNARQGLPDPGSFPGFRQAVFGGRFVR